MTIVFFPITVRYIPKRCGIDTIPTLPYRPAMHGSGRADKKQTRIAPAKRREQSVFIFFYANLRRRAFDYKLLDNQFPTILNINSGRKGLDLLRGGIPNNHNTPKVIYIIIARRSRSIEYIFHSAGIHIDYIGNSRLAPIIYDSNAITVCQVVCHII